MRLAKPSRKAKAEVSEQNFLVKALEQSPSRRRQASVRARTGASPGTLSLTEQLRAFGTPAVSPAGSVGAKRVPPARSALNKRSQIASLTFVREAFLLMLVCPAHVRFSACASYTQKTPACRRLNIDKSATIEPELELTQQINPCTTVSRGHVCLVGRRASSGRHAGRDTG